MDPLARFCPPVRLVLAEPCVRSPSLDLLCTQRADQLGANPRHAEVVGLLRSSSLPTLRHRPLYSAPHPCELRLCLESKTVQLAARLRPRKHRSSPFKAAQRVQQQTSGVSGECYETVVQSFLRPQRGNQNK